MGNVGYDHDLSAWSRGQAALLCARRFRDLDLGHLSTSRTWGRRSVGRIAPLPALALFGVGLLTASAPPVLADGREPVRSLLEMRRERVVVQEWDLSCGAAALATILHYQHRDFVPEREIAEALIGRKEYLSNPDLVHARQGFSLLDLKRFVDGRGYRGIGYGSLELDNLDEYAPIITPVSFHGYPHFVVYRGRRGNRILLADPAWGNRTVTVEQFEDAWIRYPEFGRVGFIVANRDGSVPPNALAPLPSDFVFLR